MLKHENIVNLIETFKKNGKTFLVFEFVDRNMLEALDEEPYGLSVDRVRYYSYQIMKSIAFCHQNNIVHRGIPFFINIRRQTREPSSFTRRYN